MPMAAPSLRACGCVVGRGQRCRHAIERDRERKARFDQSRPSARERGYTSKWERERKAYLAANPKCSRCPDEATAVDHVIPHRGDQRLFWNRKNWQGLCAHCHNALKQAEERRR